MINIVTRKVITLSCSTLAISCLFGSNAYGIFTFNVQEVGTSVVVTGSGSINTQALSLYSVAAGLPNIFPHIGFLEAGSLQTITAESFSGLSGPSFFGSGPQTEASSGSGDDVAIFSGLDVSVPNGYVSGAPLSDMATFNSETFETLGVTPGTYIYTWGSGPTADSLLLNIGVVPEAASLAMIAVPLAVAQFRRRRGRRPS